MTISTRTALVRTVLAAALLMLLSGCRLTLAVEVDVDRDGGGTLLVSVATDAELNEIAMATGTDPLDRLVQRVEALEDGWRVRDTVDDGDGTRIVELTTSFADPAGFARRYGEISAALDAPEGRLLGPLRIAVDEEADTVVVEGATAVLLSEVAAADLGTDITALTEQLEGAVVVTVSVRTPGTPVAAPTGTVRFEDEASAEGPALVTWTAPIGGEQPISLVAERGGPDVLRQILIVAAGLVALLLIAGGIWAQRRT